MLLRIPLISLVFLLAPYLQPVSCQTTAPTSQPTKTAQGTLRLATWNLLNLFDNYDHPGKPDENTSPKGYLDFLSLVRVIDRLDVDVLGVQEVENRAILERLNRHLKRPFLYLELFEGNDHRGIDVGLLSRVPIIQTTSHRLLPLAGDYRFSRDFPVFRLRLSPHDVIDVGVVHLKSKWGKKAASDARRKAEADAIAAMAEAWEKDSSTLGLVVMGDFNDRRDSRPLRTIMSKMKDHTTHIPIMKRFTFIYKGEGEQIDFVLSTRGLFSRTARIVRQIDRASDHFPVIVDMIVPHPVRRTDVPRGRPFVEPKRPAVQAGDLKRARRLLLKEVVVEGKVVKVFRPRSRTSAILNFAVDHRQAIVAYIPRSGLDLFGDLDALVGKTVRLAGPLSLHNGAVQIVLTRPEQILSKSPAVRE